MRFRRVDATVWSATGGASVAIHDRARPRTGLRPTNGLGAERATLVRRYLEAFFAGDLATAREMVTPDFTFDLVAMDGRPIVVVGFDAVNDFVRERSETLGITVMYELVEFMAGDDQVVVVFEEQPPLAPGASSRQLALWGFRDDRIASVRIFGVPIGLDPRGTASPATSDQAIAIAFIEAWMHDDRERMAELCEPDVTCRWVGFAPESSQATGIDDIIRIGKTFERARRPISTYRQVDALDGRDHVAVLMEAAGDARSPERTVSLGVYRVRRGRIASVVVYADRIE